MSEYDRGGSYTAEVRVCVRVSVCMYEREGDGDRRGCEPVLSPAVFCVLFSNEAKLNELSSLAFLTLIHTQQGFRECETGLYALKADSLPVCLSLLHPRKQKEIQYVLDIVWIICSNGNLDCFEMMPFFFFTRNIIRCVCFSTTHHGAEFIVPARQISFCTSHFDVLSSLEMVI